MPDIIHLINELVKDTPIFVSFNKPNKKEAEKWLLFKNICEIKFIAICLPLLY